jgi:hypothetical protein
VVDEPVLVAGLVVVGVVAVLDFVVVVLGVVVAVCDTGGALAAVTVFVPDPHPASSAAAPSAVTVDSALARTRVIDQSYSPPPSRLLAWCHIWRARELVVVGRSA